MNRYFVDEEGRVIDSQTGEVTTREGIKEAKQKEIEVQYVEMVEELIRIGTKPDLRMAKDRKGQEHSVFNVKEGFHFVKVFKTDIRKTLEESDISVYARAFLYSCLGYLNFPTNSLIIDGKTPTNEVLIEKFKIKRSKLYHFRREDSHLKRVKGLAQRGRGR